MRLIILGCTGMLGSMLTFTAKRQRRDVVALRRSDFDAEIDNVCKLGMWLLSKPWSCTIVNCIGAIPQRAPTVNSTIHLNQIFPHELHNWCQNVKCNLIHISTNCVFSGDSDVLYTELNHPDATDDYGRTKTLGEPASTHNTLVIRCSIIGPELRESHGTGLMEWFLRSNTDNEICGYSDHFWNGITTFELSKIILEHVDNGDYYDGKLLHYYSCDNVSKLCLLQLIKEVYDTCHSITSKKAGLKRHLLSSVYTKPRNSIRKQLDELHEIDQDFRTFKIVM